MILEGVSLGDLKQVRVADCQASENEILCEGREGTLHVKSEGPLQLVYSYPFPFPTVFTPILKNNKPAQNQDARIKLAMLEEVKHKMQLTEVSGATSRQKSRCSTFVVLHPDLGMERGLQCKQHRRTQIPALEHAVVSAFSLPGRSNRSIRR
jgi:hypothetical protein